MVNIDYTKFKLSNGIKCILYQRKEVHSISIKVTVNVGSLDEDLNTNGLAHFIEHVSHDGTEDLPNWEDVENFKNDCSASTNAFTNTDITQYYGRFPSQFAEKAIYYFSQIVLKPLFKESDVEKERKIIIDELKGYEDEIDYKVVRNIKENRFIDSNTPFSYEIIGIEDKIRKYTKEDLVNFWKKYYHPENIEIYIVGNFDTEEISRNLEKHFGQFKTNSTLSTPNYKTQFPEYTGFKFSSKQKLDLDKYYLTFNFPSLDFKTANLEERLKLDFIEDMLASSSFFQSVLWQKLRQELGIVYGVFTTDYDLFSRNLFIIETSFNKEHLKTVVLEIVNGVNSFKTGKITEDVFNAKKKKIVDTQLMELDRPDNVLYWIYRNEKEIEQHGRGLLISEYLDFVRSLKFEDTIELSNQIFDWSKLNIGLVGEMAEDKLQDELKKIIKDIPELATHT